MMYTLSGLDNDPPSPLSSPNETYTVHGRDRGTKVESECGSWRCHSHGKGVCVAVCALHYVCCNVYCNVCVAVCQNVALGASTLIVMLPESQLQYFDFNPKSETPKMQREGGSLHSDTLMGMTPKV